MKKRLAAALCAASILWAGAFVPARAERRAGRRACRACSIFGRGPQHRLCLCAGRAGPGVRRRQMPARLRGGHGAPAGPAARVRCWFATIRRRTRTRSFLPRRVREAEACGALLANAAPSVDRQRVQFPGGMQANLADTRASGSWHTFVYSVDASQPGVTEGKTVTSFDGAPLRSIRTMPPGSTPMKRSTG